MAQEFINYMVSKGDEYLENQIRELRTQNEFSDCNENLLMQAVDEIEQSHCNERKPIKKRKKQIDNCEKENKKVKLGATFTCEYCDRVYNHRGTLNRHQKSHFTIYTCEKCDKSFTRDGTLKKHKEKCGKPISKKSKKKPSSTVKNQGHTCKHCGLPFTDIDSLLHHVIANHPLNQTGGDMIHTPPKRAHEATKNEKPQKKRFHFRKNALNGTVNQTSIIPEANEKYDMLQFLANAKEDIENELLLQREKQRNIKWYINVRVEMIRDIDDGNQEKAHPHFRSKNYISLPNENNDHNINEAFQSVNRAMEEFIHRGSNWILNKIISLEVHTVQYSPINGSSYIELPPKIRNSRGVVNIKNNDEKCFLWSVLAALHPASNNPQRVSHYEAYEHELNMKGIGYPVSLASVQKFEKQNKISVNVFGYEEGEVFPLYLTKLD